MQHLHLSSLPSESLLLCCAIYKNSVQYYGLLLCNYKQLTECISEVDDRHPGVSVYKRHMRSQQQLKLVGF